MRLTDSNDYINRSSISIHALARSATEMLNTRLQSLPYFNPRTREECDQWQHRGRKSICNFNPRTREECDNSLHCPVFYCSNFNPRTREECDKIKKNLAFLLVIFQSTHSRGVRHVC